MGRCWLGGGQLLHCIKGKGLEEYGIESDVSQYHFTKNKGYNVLNAFIDPVIRNSEIDSLIREADVVSLLMVLEHIEDPASMIGYLKDNMKKGSCLVLEVPRHPSVASFLNVTYQNIIYRHMTLPEHLQIFHEHTLQYLFGNEFEMIAQWSFGEGFSDLINFPVIASGEYREELYIPIMKLNNEIQRIFDKAGLADVMLVAAKKVQ